MRVLVCGAGLPGVLVAFELDRDGLKECYRNGGSAWGSEGKREIGKRRLGDLRMTFFVWGRIDGRLANRRRESLGSVFLLPEPKDGCRRNGEYCEKDGFLVFHRVALLQKVRMRGCRPSVARWTYFSFVGAVARESFCMWH